MEQEFADWVDAQILVDGMEWQRLREMENMLQMEFAVFFQLDEFWDDLMQFIDEEFQHKDARVLNENIQGALIRNGWGFFEDF